MPNLDEIVKKRDVKKFKKKNYRPWDLGGTSDVTEETPDPRIVAVVPKQPNNRKEPAEIKQTDAVQMAVPTLDNKIDTTIDNKKVPNRKPIDNIGVTIRKQTDNNQVSEKITNGEQLGNILDPRSLRNVLAKVSGFQKKVLDLMVDICVARKANETGPIETKVVSEYIGTTYGSTKTTINRLVSKGIIERQAGKTARGGYINFSISEEVIHIVTELRKQFTRYQNPIEMLNQIRSKLDNNIDNDLIHSSSNINKTTTTDKKLNQNLSEEWKCIDYQPLSHIGFSKTQIKQLVGHNMPEIVQESINHFAYALEHNKKYKNHDNPLNLLMGVLRKGNNWFEKDYESPQEKALREMIERKKKAKETEEAQIKELLDLEFPKWEAGLSEEERMALLPDNLVSSKIEAPVTAYLRSYFLNSILLPRLKEEEVIK